MAIIVIIAVAVFAPFVTTHDPILDADFSALRAEPSGAHWMGTDDIGRDLYSRIIYGARVSLFVAFMAVMVGDLLGAAWGVATGYIGGRFDIYSQRFLELMMSFPTLILAMLLVLAMGAGMWTVIVAISVTRVPLAVRVVRSVTLSVKENAYVDAAQAIGASGTRVMVRPHCAPMRGAVAGAGDRAFGVGNYPGSFAGLLGRGRAATHRHVGQHAGRHGRGGFVPALVDGSCSPDWPSP